MLQRLRPDIRADEYAALLEVKGLIAEGKIRIKMWSSNDCIGGQMAKVMGVQPGPYVTSTRSPPLKRLFFYDHSLLFSLLLGGHRTTPSWLVLRAIDRFLAGKDPWSLT
jgi:hypothetical protein